jgi:glycosyltransferase involved in cell wall biosynthesis
MPLVTVIIPHYNRSCLLLEAVDSVLNQTFEDFECIIVDDGSTEPLPTLPSDNRLRLIRKPHSGLPGEVRNRGAEEAAGRLLAFLDSDDLWRPEKLALQTAFMKAEGPRISHTREQWLRGGREVSQASQKHRREGDIFEDALKKCIIGPSTVMIETSLFRETGGFDETLEIAEDYEYWLRITARHTVGYLHEILTVKRAGDWHQLSEKYGQIEIFRIRALKGLVDRGFSPPGRMPEARAELSRKCRIYAAGCRKRGKDEEAVKYEALTKKYEEGV